MNIHSHSMEDPSKVQHYAFFDNYLLWTLVIFIPLTIIATSHLWHVALNIENYSFHQLHRRIQCLPHLSNISLQLIHTYLMVSAKCWEHQSPSKKKKRKAFLQLEATDEESYPNIPTDWKLKWGIHQSLNCFWQRFWIITFQSTPFFQIWHLNLVAKNNVNSQA